jgi:hypothetical protein
MKTTELSKKKADLEKQLNEIHNVERKTTEKNLMELIKAVKPEIDAYKSLGVFQKRGKITVELTYDIDLNMDMYDLGYNPDSDANPLLDLGEFEGGCSIDKVKEPKNHKIAQFISEDKFANMGVDQYEDIVAVHPEVKKHCDNFLKAKRTLAKKVAKIADKLGLDKETAFDAVLNELD